MFRLISSKTRIIWFLLNEVIKSYCKLVEEPFILFWSLLEKKKKKRLQSKGAAEQTLDDKAELLGHPGRGRRDGGSEGSGDRHCP